MINDVTGCRTSHANASSANRSGAEMNWANIDSLELRRAAWHLSPGVATPPSLSAKHLNQNRGRYGDFSFSIQNDLAHCVLTQANKPGCRSMGLLLSTLLGTYGIDHLPHDVYIEASPPLSARAIITLRMIASIEWRNQIASAFRHELLEQNAFEDNYAFEARGVDRFGASVKGFEALDPSSLNLGISKSPMGRTRVAPDGLYTSPTLRSLTIIEAKRRNVSFEEGYSQLIQYFGLTRFHPDYADKMVALVLVSPARFTAPRDITACAFMASKRAVRFHVPYDG